MDMMHGVKILQGNLSSGPKVLQHIEVLFNPKYKINIHIHAFGNILPKVDVCHISFHVNSIQLAPACVSDLSD